LHIHIFPSILHEKIFPLVDIYVVTFANDGMVAFREQKSALEFVKEQIREIAIDFNIEWEELYEEGKNLREWNLKPYIYKKYNKVNGVEKIKLVSIVLE